MAVIIARSIIMNTIIVDISGTTSFLNMTPMIIPVKAAEVIIERLMPPMSMTTNIPRVYKPNSPTWAIIASKLLKERKFLGSSIDNPTKTMARIIARFIFSEKFLLKNFIFFSIFKILIFYIYF